MRSTFSLFLSFLSLSSYQIPQIDRQIDTLFLFNRSTDYQAGAVRMVGETATTLGRNVKTSELLNVWRNASTRPWIQVIGFARGRKKCNPRRGKRRRAKVKSEVECRMLRVPACILWSRPKIEFHLSPDRFHLRRDSHETVWQGIKIREDRCAILLSRKFFCFR